MQDAAGKVSPMQIRSRQFKEFKRELYEQLV